MAILGNINAEEMGAGISTKAMKTICRSAAQKSLLSFCGTAVELECRLVTWPRLQTFKLIACCDCQPPVEGPPIIDKGKGQVAHDLISWMLHMGTE